MSMVDMNSFRPMGAPDQKASRMFRSKPDQNGALQNALNQGGTQTPTPSNPMQQTGQAMQQFASNTSGAFHKPLESLGNHLTQPGPTNSGPMGAIGGLFGGGGNGSFHGTVQPNGGDSPLAQQAMASAMHRLPNSGVSGYGQGGVQTSIGGGNDAPMLPGGFRATADPNNPGKFLAGAGGAIDALKAYQGSDGAKQDARNMQDYYKQHGTFGGFKYSTGVVVPDGPSAPKGPGPGLMNATAPGWGGLAAQPQGQGAEPQAAAAQHFNTRLMEGDPGKLADAAHAAKSPKYDFLQLAQKGTHNYDDLGGMLKELQGGANGRLWNGWSANKDKLTFNGDPSQLAPEWNGARSVDAIGAYGDFANGGEAKGFRWGVEGPAGAAPPMHGPIMTPMQGGNFDTNQIASMGLQDGQPMPDEAGARSVLDQILAQLQNPQQMALQKALGAR